MSGSLRKDRKSLSSALLRSIFVYTIVILLCFSCVFSAFHYFVYEKGEEQALAGITEQAARILDGQDAQDAIRILEQQFSDDLRYTLIDREGNVVFDSDGFQGENHADRPEVKEAEEKGTSSITRYSSTLGQDTVYSAVLLSSGNVLRLAEQRASFFAVFEITAPALGVALLGAILLAIAASRILTRWVLTPLNSIDIANPLDNAAYDEMQPLLERIEVQQQQLKDQNKELARAENLRREFSANVSHELKTPLQVISGYAELLSQEEVPEEDKRRFAGIILSESEDMTALINDVLVLSRIDDPVLKNAGREEVELLSFVHDVVNRFDPLSAKRSVRIRCLGSTVTVKANRGLLDQLVSNLVSNAVKYSEAKSEVVVSVGKNLAVATSDNTPEAYIKVKDSGCGIPSEEQEKIFERFYRVDKSRSKESGGTGLGLAIAKHAAAFHDASITVESVVGQGSVFTVHFPINLKG